jgi:spore germination protein GerM
VIRRRAGLVAVLAVAAGLLAACGVPGDHIPREIDASNVPFQLLAPTAGATSTTVPSAFTRTAQAVIYLANADGRLVATPRDVEAPITVGKAITALLRGPTSDEANQLSTSITSDTKLLDVRGPTDGLVTIDLSRHVLDITGRQQILALAQVVYTATSIASVDRVLFKFDGSSHEVPNGDGKLTSSPLGRQSYRALIPTP